MCQLHTIQQTGTYRIKRDVNNLAIDRTAHAPTYERNPRYKLS